jgi:hypothetical protein
VFEGGFSEVYIGSFAGSKVAMKILKFPTTEKGKRDDSKFLTRKFIHESTILHSLKSSIYVVNLKAISIESFTFVLEVCFGLIFFL